VVAQWPYLSHHRHVARSRLLTWAALSVILGIDAYIATPISLGAVYFGPLAFAAMRLGKVEALSMAAVAACGRVLFGPAGDPLGLEAFAVNLPPSWQHPAIAVVSLVGYAGTAMLVIALGRQQRRLDRLRGEVESDPLTGIGNRRFLLRCMEEARRGGVDSAVLVVDVDHFKRINDTWGHDAGDRVLVALSARLGQCLRTRDALARVGGEEFVVLLPGQDAAAAAAVADRILERVRESAFSIGSEALPVTVSVGVAMGLPGPDLLVRADKALYAAKAGGRNQQQLAA
jgi:diguanylate cyclase (GGDEF)-like protein